MNRNSIGRFCGIAATLTLVLITTGVPPVNAQEQDGGAAGDWLSQYSSARALGLGGAFVAVTDEALGVMWNPAGLSFMSQNEAYFETARLYEGTALYSFSFAVPARKLPSIGLTVLSLNSGDFERTSELNESLGAFSEGDIAFVLSGSKSLSPRFALGANLKIVRQTVEEFGGTGVGADLGLLFDVTPTIRLGASALNLGGPSLTLRETSEQFPVEFRVGAAARLFRGQGIASVELDQNSFRGTSVHLGTEYWLYRSVALRVGYQEDSPAAGFSYRIPSGLRFDYGLTNEELGMSHRFGISYRFGGFHANSEANPPVFSPLGQQSVTKIELRSKTKAETQEWSLEIRDKLDHVVRQFGGKGSPPAHVMWDGKDESGLPLPDGDYHYALLVMDAEGREVASRERMVEISTGGPQGSVPVSVTQE